MGTSQRLETIKVDVYECARCGEDHADLIFIKMAGEPISVEGFKYGWWTLCPVTRDPLIMRRDDDNNEQ